MLKYTTPLTNNLRLISSLMIASLMASPLALAMETDDPLVAQLTVDKFEKRHSINDKSAQPFAWEAEAWLGYDINKLVFKTEGERASGKTESAELQGLIRSAIAPYWNIQMGMRHDFNPEPSQNWAVIGLQGMAPYFIETDLNLFITNGKQTNLRLSAEYEAMITQQLVLSPSAEINLYGKNDEVRGIGSGISSMEFGVRLAYEIRREFAPYIGINWEQTFGKTADYARHEGESTNDIQLVAGVRFWF